MGTHAGEPELAGDRYVGLAVSRAARICAAGHGGQVLVSSSARSLLADDDRATLRPLGSFSVKDFSAPEPIYQVVVEGARAKFPPLRAEGRPSRRRWLLVAAAALVAAAVAGAVVALSSGGSGSGSVEVGPTALAVVDPKSNKVVDAIELGFTSNLIAVGEGYVWVVDRDGGTSARSRRSSRRSAHVESHTTCSSTHGLRTTPTASPSSDRWPTGANIREKGNLNLFYFDRPKVNAEIQRIEGHTGEARRKRAGPIWTSS